jgi:hypothetical protein
MQTFFGRLGQAVMRTGIMHRAKKEEIVVARVGRAVGQTSGINQSRIRRIATAIVADGCRTIGSTLSGQLGNFARLANLIEIVKAILIFKRSQ